LPDVPYISIEVSSELEKHLAEFIDLEGRIIERAPILITDIIERPGGLIVKKSYTIRFMVFKATFNNISDISWWSVLLVEKTGIPGENHTPVSSH
jgi:hypothetical protein